MRQKTFSSALIKYECKSITSLPGIEPFTQIHDYVDYIEYQVFAITDEFIKGVVKHREFVCQKWSYTGERNI